MFNIDVKLIIHLERVGKGNYGRHEYYPINEKGRLLAKLLGQKHITAKNVDVLMEMGVLVVIRPRA